MSQSYKDHAQTVVAAVGEKMFGLDEVVRLALVALYTDGHVLLEGNPGLGKTELVKALSETLKLDFGRIQFTPDLMPSDITGTEIPGRGDAGLSFQPGPIFTSLLLADEINRASPKTQAAMLEGMAERRVTVLGTTYQLPDPFMVLATQNPIDHEGTYDLPEAQADRFLFKILMPTPETETLRKILGKQTGVTTAELKPAPPQPPAAAPGRLATNRDQGREIVRVIRQALRRVPPMPLVETHVLNLVLASNRQYELVGGLPPAQLRRLGELVDPLLTWGLGPRAAIGLMSAAKAWALLFNPDGNHADGAALARIAAPVLRHRVKLDFDWRERYRRFAGRDHETTTEALNSLLADLVVAAAPPTDHYRATMVRHLQAGGLEPSLE